MGSRNLACIAVVLFCSTLPAAAAVDVALVPSTSLVLPGADVWVTLRVTQAGSLFNGYTAAIDFDPTRLEFVPEPAQQGAYMLGACGNTFHSFNAQPTRLTIQHYLFCSGTSLTGPGDLYVLHFRSTANGGATTISFGELRFYNAGHPVVVGGMSNATITIEGPTDTGPMVGHGGPWIMSAPNPFIERTWIQVGDATSGAALVTIHDVRGRRVRTLALATDARGRGTAVWDGRDDTQHRAAAGTYIVVLRTAHGIESQRIVRTR